MHPFRCNNDKQYYGIHQSMGIAMVVTQRHGLNNKLWWKGHTEQKWFEFLPQQGDTGSWMNIFRQFITEWRNIKSRPITKCLPDLCKVGLKWGAFRNLLSPTVVFLTTGDQKLPEVAWMTTAKKLVDKFSHLQHTAVSNRQQIEPI